MTLLDTIGINQLKLLLLCEKIYLLNLFYAKTDYYNFKYSKAQSKP